MKKRLAGLLGLMLAAAFALPAMAEEGIAAIDDVTAEIAANDYTIGNIVTYGTYEQDNDEENGEEAIEWIVLDVEGDQALLLSRYGLDAQAYNTYTKRITWCRCSLRKWVDYNFLKMAFTVEERERIASTTVSNPATEGYDTYSCDDTTNQVYLLSYDEALAYLPTEADRQTTATAYAIARGAYVDEDTGYCWWWLRSPGEGNTYACAVRTDGRVTGYSSSLEVNRTSGCIRPVIWLNIGTTAEE